MIGAERGFIVRGFEPSDVEGAAYVMFEAFETFNKQRGLPPPFTLGEATSIVGGQSLCTYLSVLVAISTSDDSVIGICTIDHRDTVASIGPVAVAPRWSDKKVGQAILRFAIEVDEAKHGVRSIMLQQDTSNLKSFCMYVKLGFAPVETCLYLTGLADPVLSLPEEYALRRLHKDDAESCDLLFSTLFPGVSRLAQLTNSIEEASTAFCVTETMGGPIVAYTSGMDQFGHIVARDRGSFKALLIGASAYVRQEEQADSKDFGFHFLGRVYPDVLFWAIREAGFRLEEQSTLMSRGPGLRIDPLSPLLYCPDIHY
jgi:predicted N-acetyltransferase YhbS